MYSLLRSLLFQFPPEDVHYFSMNMLRRFQNVSVLKKIVSSQFIFSNENLKRELFGLTFKNPVGLGAGFDKNAAYLSELEMLGFSHIEIGTVTPKAQAGNDKPRLF